MDDVTSQVDAEIASDGSRQRLLRVRLSHHHTTSLCRILAFPNHGDYWAGRDEVDEFVVKWLVLQVDVVLFNVFFRSLHELHSNELEAALFESLDDVTNKPALNSVRLHHDKSAVGVRHGR